LGRLYLTPSFWFGLFSWAFPLRRIDHLLSTFFFLARPACLFFLFIDVVAAGSLFENLQDSPFSSTHEIFPHVAELSVSPPSMKVPMAFFVFRFPPPRTNPQKTTPSFLWIRTTPSRPVPYLFFQLMQILLISSFFFLSRKRTRPFLPDDSRRSLFFLLTSADPPSTPLPFKRDLLSWKSPPPVERSTSLRAGPLKRLLPRSVWGDRVPFCLLFEGEILHRLKLLLFPLERWKSFPLEFGIKVVVP